MPDIITDFIGNAATNGITDAGTDSKPANNDPSGTGTNTRRNFEPEIINGYEAESPATERIAGFGDGNTPKRRGRPLGSRNNSGGQSSTGNSEKAKVLLSSFSIEGLLIGIHQMGAALLKTPELAIDPPEAKQLADAIQAVAKEYNHVINPKTAAWIQLCVALGAVYGTRIVAVQMRTKASRKTAKVMQMPSAQPAPEPIIPPSPVERESGL